MASSGFGNNRLATGFHKTRAILAEQVAFPSTTPQRAPQSVASSPGNSADDAIEISDDDDSSSESGGMLLNVGDATILQPHHLMAVDDDGEMEEGETKDDEGLEARNPETKESVASESPLIQSTSQTGSLQSDQSGNVERPGTSDTHGRLRLADLSQPELELQFRYIFSYLKREEVDLGRSPVCLGCLQEGHMQASCPEKACIHCGIADKHPSRLCPLVSRCVKCRERGHTSDDCIMGIKVTTVPCDLCGILGHIEDSCPERFFPPSFQVVSSPARVWVSCCHCASKSHYVGDCPELDQNFAPRWSMKSIDYTQIINLSLESNMRTLEKEAENRGLRPEGLSIKGRAGIHYAGNSGTGLSDDDSSEDNFIRPRIETSVRNHTARHDFSFRAPERFPPRSARLGDTGYDRYNPSTHRSQRPRNDWYSTDSFGQRRSRSPSPARLQPRRDDFDDPGIFRRRSRSPREFDRSRADRIRARSPRVRAPSANNIPPHRDDSDHLTQQPLAGRPKDDISIKLPVRKGSTHSNIPTSQANETQETSKNQVVNVGQQSRQDDAMSRGARPVKSTKKSKQTKAAARSSQADDESESDPAEPMPQLDIIASIDADIVFPHRLPPNAILQKFVEAMNVHRQNIGYRHLKLKYEQRKNNRSLGKPFFFDNSRPAGQRDLKIDTKRATFIWQWSKTSLPEILRQTRLFRKTERSAGAASTPFAHMPSSATGLTSENRAFLELFGPMGGENLANLGETVPNGIEHDEENDQNIHDGKSKEPSKRAMVDPKINLRPRGKWSLDALRTSAARAGGRKPDVREFVVYLDLFNAPRFDLGIAPMFLRCEEGRFYYIDSAIADFNERSIPVSRTHIEELWAFFTALPQIQKNARLEVRSRLQKLSHPVDRSLTRKAAEDMLKNIMPTESLTKTVPDCVGKTIVATRSQHSELTGIDYDALERAEKGLGFALDSDSEDEDWTP